MSTNFPPIQGQSFRLCIFTHFNWGKKNCVCKWLIILHFCFLNFVQCYLLKLFQCSLPQFYRKRCRIWYYFCALFFEVSIESWSNWQTVFLVFFGWTNFNWKVSIWKMKILLKLWWKRSNDEFLSYSKNENRQKAIPENLNHVSKSWYFFNVIVEK